MLSSNDIYRNTLRQWMTHVQKSHGGGFIPIIRHDTPLHTFVRYDLHVKNILCFLNAKYCTHLYVWLTGDVKPKKKKSFL